MAPLMYGLTKYAEEDEQHQYLSNEFDFVCCSKFDNRITYKFSEETNKYSLEHCCFIPKLEDAEGNQYDELYSTAFELDVLGGVIVAGKFKIYTGNCVLLTSARRCDMDRRTMSNMIRWLQKRKLMNFCEILDKNG